MLAPWEFMWTLAIGVYAACKSTTWLGPRVPQAPLWKQAAYLLGWPGMDAVSFLGHAPISTRSECRSIEWRASTTTLLFGATFLFVVARLIPQQDEYLIGWTGMIGIVLVLHFGLFQLLSCCWRSLGIEARPIMNRPLASTSLSEFWGRRWNTAFRDLAHRFVFRPFTAWFGPRFGLFAGFLFSGAVHDLVISVPAKGGYGGPTAFFAIQGAAIIFERSAFGRRMGVGSGGSGRAFTFLVLVAPLFLLFHPRFVVRVIVPFMRTIGAL
jgi:alginate O-acetyltransferase complex protein AlgI